MSMEELAERLRPLARELKGVSLADPAAAESSIETLLPFDGDVVRGIRAAAEEGVRAGWLLPRENGEIRFGRVTKDLEGFSIDAVLMSTPGPRHRHPRGEIDLCLARSGSPRFDGREPGWVVYGPDSTHVPTVTGGEMLILYFLPGASIEFL